MIHLFGGETLRHNEIVNGTFTASLSVLFGVNFHETRDTSDYQML